MQVVFFPEELSARAPDMMGCLCIAPGGEWITMVDVVAAIVRLEPVSIRPASDTEMKRAEALVALFEIGKTLGEKVGTLLDQDPPEVAMGKFTKLRDAMESVETGPLELLDRPQGE